MGARRFEVDERQAVDSARALAAFAAQARRPGFFPPDARKRSVDAITDCVGCLLAGAAEPVRDILLAVVATTRHPAGSMISRLPTTDLFGTPQDAAMFGGTLAHALDYDDTNHPGYAHPSAVIVPALIAAATLAGSRGRDFVSAHIVGVEAFGKLGRALNTDHYARGWHTTSTFGTIAATLATACLLGIDEDQTVTALGIAASFASGMRANFGSMVKPLHAGSAARNGVLAVLLARNGLTAGSGVMDHPCGYLSLFSGEGFLCADWLSRPGEPLEILTEYGLALKAYPSCGATHPAIEAAILGRGDLAGQGVAGVRVGISDLAREPLIYDWPRTPLEAKFSMRFCVAAALADGAVDIGTFQEGRLTDPEIVRLMGLTEVTVDETVRADREFAAIVELEGTEGLKVCRMVPLAKGKPARWFSEEDMARKFFDAAALSMSTEASTRVLQLLRTLDGEGQVSELSEMLR